MGWSAALDESSGSYYYYNEETEETTWDKPAGVEIEGLPAEAENPQEATTASTVTASADYYNSKEYYDWYYSQYAAHAATATSTNDDDTKAPGTTTIPPLPGSHQYASAWNPLAAATGEELDPDFQPDYTLSASFNARNGRFTSLSGPNGTQFDHISKAERQMSHFFDIRQYQEDRNRERMERKPVVKLTKKELEKYKEKSKMKKKERLLKRLGDD
ncbi:UNVERIFIED_CONTAM: hypothetical protein HDU68_002439 [Siphonaria sp. JEL0065]|nr:hypothetical protein HDU68_002439 [Siphonaria sp. JEL0065]